MPTRNLIRRPRRAEAASHGGADLGEVAGSGGGGLGDAGGGAVLAEDLAHGGAPFAGGDAGLRGGDRGGHDAGALAGGGFQRRQGGVHGGGVAGVAPGLEAGDLLGLDGGVDDEDAAFAGGERGRLGLGEAVDADDGGGARLDAGEPGGVGGDERGLHVVDGGDGAAHLGDAGELGAGAGLQLLDLGGDRRVAVEEVAVLEEVGLVGHDLLHAERPLLVPGAGEAEGLVPGRELDGAGAGVLREGDGEHLEEDAVDVVLRLLLGQAEGVDLHAVAEAAELGVGDAVVVAADLVPELDEGAHLAELGDEADAGVHEEGDAGDDLGEVLGLDLLADLVEDGAGGGEREGELLLGRRAGFLQVVAADVHRVPLRDRAVAVLGDVGDEPERRLGREDVGAAGEVFLDDVVLNGALELG